MVISAVGKRRDWRARSALVVSPLRTPTLQGRFNSSSGALRARSVSAARARMGVIHKTVSGGAGGTRFFDRETASGLIALDEAADDTLGDSFDGIAKQFSAASHTA